MITQLIMLSSGTTLLFTLKNILAQILNLPLQKSILKPFSPINKANRAINERPTFMKIAF